MSWYAVPILIWGKSLLTDHFEQKINAEDYTQHFFLIFLIFLDLIPKLKYTFI